jgi:hypothetical protein
MKRNAKIFTSKCAKSRGVNALNIGKPLISLLRLSSTP